MPNSSASDYYLTNNNLSTNLLKECIDKVGNTLENMGWKYNNSILEATNDAIIIDSDLATIPLQQAIKVNYPNKEIVLQDKLKCYEIRNFLELDLKPRENIITPWLPTQGLVMVYAPRGVGKTYFALTVAVAIASGSPCFKWEVPKPRGVLYLDGEMPATTMQERLAKLISNNPTELSAPFKLITRDLNAHKHFSLTSTAGQQDIEKNLEGIEVIIVDNISTLCSGKENDAEGWVPIQEWALKMRACGISVLFIHHAGKGGNQRGTSKKEDVLDTVIALRRPANYTPTDGAVFELNFEKSRGFTGDDAEPVHLSLTETSLSSFPLKFS